MGFKLRNLIEPIKREITIENITGRTVAVDTFNILYQFLFAIKSRHGSLLMNRNREITSHISGLFYKTISFIEHNITPIYCFDGMDKQHKLRWDVKKEKHVKLTPQMIESAKELLDYIGIPYIQCISEGEAQCVYLTEKEKDVWCTISQDYDVMAYGGSRLVRNLTMARKRKVKGTTINIPIEYVSLDKFLKHYNITQDGLIDMTILMGNDFFEGIKKIGEKNALKLIQLNKKIENISQLTNKKIDTKKGVIEQDEFLDIVKNIRELYKNPKIEKNYIIERKSVKFDKLYEFMIEKNDFSKERIESSINKLRNLTTSKTQKSILDFKESHTRKNKFIETNKKSPIKTTLKGNKINQNKFF